MGHLKNLYFSDFQRSSWILAEFRNVVYLKNCKRAISGKCSNWVIRTTLLMSMNNSASLENSLNIGPRGLQCQTNL